MSNIIQLLPDHIANQIAAGEVVQRPASVVKELLENAIDAGASRISLHVKQAGKTLIQVIDDGKGMASADAQMCFERHATSKLSKAEDLFNIKTKGFRGEALASIAAVAQVELITKPEDQDLGTKVDIAASELRESSPVAANTGTSIAVKNLFYNIPARRNFLKSDAVEMRHIIDEFQRVAIPHSQIQFELYHNGSELFLLNQGNLRQRVVGIFGNKFNEKIAPISEQTELVKIDGFIGKPTAARKTRGEQYFFVNNRFIKNNYLHHAVKTAFEGLIPADHYPSYFIFLELDPSTIDVNIHPTKTEVKFEDEKAIYAFLKACIRKTLGQFQVAPSLDFTKDPDLEPRTALQGYIPREPKIEVDRNFNPFEKNQGLNRSSFQAKAKGDWEAVLENIGNPQEIENSSHQEIESAHNNLSFSTHDVHSAPKLFQWQKKYIVSSLRSGLILIDQQKAHERIHFEQLVNTQEIVSQQLLFPQSWELSAADVAVLKDILDEMSALGLNISIQKNNILELSGLPQGLKETEAKNLIDKILEDAKHEQSVEKSYVTELICKRLARSLAIKAGQYLGEEEMQRIVDQLFSCEHPNLALNGKPCFIKLEAEDIENRFENG